MVLLDPVLPGNDGIELMELVPELVDRPLIFISGYGRDETAVLPADFLPFQSGNRVAHALVRIETRHQDSTVRSQ